MVTALKAWGCLLTSFVNRNKSGTGDVYTGGHTQLKHAACIPFGFQCSFMADTDPLLQRVRSEFISSCISLNILDIEIYFE
jgi:hypothetical protein